MQKEAGAATLTAWSKYDQAGFQKIVDALIPPHVESKLEKQIKEGWEDFGNDAGKFFEKKTSLVAFAEKISGKTIHK